MNVMLQQNEAEDGIPQKGRPIPDASGGSGRLYAARRCRPRYPVLLCARAGPKGCWALGVLLAALLLAGCETTRQTSLEENRGAYQDAREFFKVGETTQPDVRRKYGTPRTIIPYEDGVVWRYSRTEEVVINAYTNTPYGTEGSLMGRFGGYQHTVLRKTMLELFFGPDGVLTHYRIYRDAP